MSTINFTVKVASAQFTIDDGVAPKLTFSDGDTYIFDQADSSNSGHILQFSITSNNSGSAEYTTGVTKTGTPGSAGAKTTIITSGSTTDTLYYYSSGGGTYGEEFSNSGFNTTAGGLLLPVLGGAGEKWGSVLNHTISYIGAYIGGTYLKAPAYADNSARDAAIGSPANGMIIYNTASGALQQYNGAWATIVPPPNINSISGFLNDDTDSTLTIFGSNFTSASVVKMFDASSGGSQIGSNATTTFNSVSKLTAVFGAGSIGASGSTAYIEVDNVGIANRFVTAITVNADPVVTNLGATGTGAVNHATNSSTHLGTYGGASAGGPADSNTSVLLNFDRGGGDDLEDSSNIGGSGHKATTEGDTGANVAVIKASPFGDGKSAIFFDGTNDYLTTVDHADWDFSNNDFTIEYWAKRTQFSNTQFHWAWTGSDGNEDVGLRFNTDGAIRSYWRNSSDSSTNYTHAETVTDDTWHHFAYVRYGTTVKIYKDGIALTQTTSVGTTAIFDFDSNLAIGRPGDSNSAYFEGYIDEFRIIKGVAVYTGNFAVPTARFSSSGQSAGASGTNIAAVSAAQTVLLIHSERTDEGNTTFTDSATTGTTHTVTASGGTIHSKLHGGIAPALTWPASGKKFGSSGCHFDGNDYVSLPDSGDWDFGTGAFTIDCWIYPTVLPSSGGVICAQYAESHVLISGGSAGALQFWDSSANITASAGTVTINAWQHIAIVRTNTSTNGIKFYRNGVLVHTGTSAGNITGDTSPMQIGRSDEGGNNQYFTGYIDVFRVSKGVARWSAAFTPPTTLYGAVASATLPTITFTGATTPALAADEDIEYTSVANTTKAANNQHLTDSGIGLTLTNLTGSDKSKATLTGTIASAGGTTHTNMPMKAQVRKTLGDAAYANASRVVTFSGSTVTTGLAPAMPVTGTGIPAATTITTVDSSTTITLSADPTGGTLTGQSLVFEDLTRITHINGSDTLNNADTMMTIATGTGGGDPVLFNARRYVGTGATRSITGFGFKSDLVAIKRRSSTANWVVQDSARGVNENIQFNTTTAQYNDTSSLGSFDVDGFSIGSQGQGNASNETYIAWGWKAGGAPSGAGKTMTDGTETTISSSATFNASADMYDTDHFAANGVTRSVNTAGKFSITKIVNPSSTIANRAVPHGLGGIPDFVLIKPLDSAGWVAYHSSLTSNTTLNNKLLNLHDDGGESALPGSGTAATNYHVNLPDNTGWDINEANISVIVYAWKAVAGVSAFGTHSGQITSVSGTTVGANGYCGFRPKFVLVKSISSAEPWLMFDAFRSGTTIYNDYFKADTDAAESVDHASVYVTPTATGFTTGSHVAVAGGTCIWVAFA